MPQQLFNDGQEIVFADLNNITKRLALELYDRILYEIMGRQTTVCFSGSFAVTYVNATTVQVAKGSGFYNDNTQVDPECQNRPLYVSANTNKTLAAADPSNNRIDLICITPALASVATSSRNVKDANSGVVSSTSITIENDWISTLSVVSGTPSGSPAAPATPAGAMVLAQVLIVAGAGLQSQSGITDKRPRYARGKTTVQSPTSAYTADLDDTDILANANGGGFTVTWPDPTLSTGRVYRVKNIGSSNNVTVAQAGSGSIEGSSTQVLGPGTAITGISNGTNYYLF